MSNKGISSKGRSKRDRAQDEESDDDDDDDNNNKKNHKRGGNSKEERSAGHELNNHNYETAHLRHKAQHESRENKREQQEQVIAQTNGSEGGGSDDSSPSLDLAFSYLEKVKERFVEEEDVYINFVEILQELAPTVGEDAGALSRDTWKCTMEKVLQLLEGETDLICYFLEFLPTQFRSSILLELSGGILQRAERILGTTKRKKVDEPLDPNQREMNDLARALRQQNSGVENLQLQNDKPRPQLDPLQCQCRGPCQCGIAQLEAARPLPNQSPSQPAAMGNPGPGMTNQGMREYENGWYGYEQDRTSAQQMYQTWGGRQPNVRGGPHPLGYPPSAYPQQPHYDEMGQMQQGWYPQREYPGGMPDYGPTAMASQFAGTYAYNPSAMYPPGYDMYQGGPYIPPQWGMPPSAQYDGKNYVNPPSSYPQQQMQMPSNMPVQVQPTSDPNMPTMHNAYFA